MAIFMLKNGLNKDNILELGQDLSFPASVVDYFKGMIGQPEGGFNPELQKMILKGEKPITVRPGTLLPDVDFDAVKAMLKDKYDLSDFSDYQQDLKAVSYALYPKVYEDYCEHFQAYNDVTRLESHVYFYGLRRGEETTLKIGEGKDLLIKFMEMSAPDEEGKRVLSFEINGSVREVTVQDKKLEVKSDKKLKADKSNPAHVGSTIPGTVSQVFVKEGEEVKQNQPLLVLEAMKLETTVVAKQDGVIDKIYVAAGDRVNTGDLLLSFQK